jgi:ribonuclease HI
MEAMGFDPSIISWLAHWFDERKIQVRFQDNFSNTYDLLRGLPQGSPLSGTLWKIYINTLQVSILKLMYMDDVVLTTTSYEKMNRATQELEKWANEHYIIFSQSKTKLMFGSPLEGSDSDLTLQGWPIEVVTHYKYLGLVLESPTLDGFGLKQHLQMERVELSRRVKILNSLAQWCSTRTLRAALHGLILSKIDYCLTAKANIIPELQVLQNIALQSLSEIVGFKGSFSMETNNILHEIWRIPTVLERFQRSLLSTTGKLITSTSPSSRIQPHLPHVLEGRMTREWLLPTDTQLRSSYNLSNSCTQDGLWETASSTPSSLNQAFCDGGYKNDTNLGTTGGILVSQNTIESQFSHAYSHVNSSYRTESLALRTMCLKLYSTKPQVNDVQVFSDSLSVIQKLIHMFLHPSKVQDPVILDILDIIEDLHNFGVSVSVHWIPGHDERFQGNGIADDLTNRAWSIKETHRKIDYVTRDSFLSPKSWPQIFPFDQFLSIKGNTRRMMCRIMTGKGAVRNVLHHWNGSFDASCRFCGQHRETTTHLIFDCQASHSPLHDPLLDAEQQRYDLLLPQNWIPLVKWCLDQNIII